MDKQKILVTGGAGFIGSTFVRLLLRDYIRWPRAKPRGLALSVVDNLSYAGDLKRLPGLKAKLNFYKADIGNKIQMEAIFSKERPDLVVNFAAQTHVDRSIIDPAPFLETNISGAHVLIDVSRKYKIKKFIHISTDEVYGQIKKGQFTEGSQLAPNSPYAASKAAADLLINSYIRTYGFPAVIVRPSNNYGPWQYPEKLIPLAILKVLRKERVPVYAQGRNIREWLYVEDCVKGIWEVVKKGRIGEIYNIGSGRELQNLEVVKMLLEILGASKNLIQFVKDRPGHDLRYSLNSKKVSLQLGWQPKVDFEEGLRNTVEWYLQHKDWALSKWLEIRRLYRR